METRVELITDDGCCSMEVVGPDVGEGPWPGVVLCMDGFGPREALIQMGQRVASWGYVVALPDLFYRVGSVFGVLPDGVERSFPALLQAFSEPEVRQKWHHEYAASAMAPAHVIMDLGGVHGYFADCDDVLGDAMAVVGYCMGGNVALRAAGLLGERVALAASFHGGFLATERADSPHCLASAMVGRVYVGAAAQDPSFPQEMEVRLSDALANAGVAYEIERYPGTAHGFAIPDLPVFHPEASARHEEVLSRLLRDAFEDLRESSLNTVHT